MALGAGPVLFVGTPLPEEGATQFHICILLVPSTK